VRASIKDFCISASCSWSADIMLAAVIGALRLFYILNRVGWSVGFDAI